MKQMPQLARQRPQYQQQIQQIVLQELPLAACRLAAADTPLPVALTWSLLLVSRREIELTALAEVHHGG
jgi:hypothetical protein